VTDETKDLFERLYRKHFRAVLCYSLARLDPERAKDATAETFLIAWRRFADVPNEPTAWLFGVARKVIAGQLRGDARREALGTRLSVVRGQGVDLTDPADEVADRDAALIALARLGTSDRELLRLVAWDGLSAKVAAQALGLSQLAFAVRLHRARRRFVAELAAIDDCARLQVHETPLSRSAVPVPLTRDQEAL
jgi:RNA polymerase sigma-70 factor (ECF subfamily)